MHFQHRGCWELTTTETPWCSRVPHFINCNCEVDGMGSRARRHSRPGQARRVPPLPDLAKWILSVAMLLGRLELLTVLVMLHPDFRRRWPRAVGYQRPREIAGYVVWTAGPLGGGLGQGFVRSWWSAGARAGAGN